jgi:NAD(P) transhydrogenase subunit alpha
MKLAVIKERTAHETRVAATPETVKKFLEWGMSVSVQEGAGEASCFADSDYESAGAKLFKDAEKTLKSAELILKVQAPTSAEIAYMKEGAALVGFLSPHQHPSLIKKLAEHKINAFAIEMVPRITRAQSMDALSSQSNLAGYKAVIDAANELNRILPMMMTAAGTIRPAKALILGAGVAGLQAIATAKRLGAIVSAFDVRPVAKEQVQSLGAKFIEVPLVEANAETSGGYAREMTEAYKQQQAQLIHDTLRDQDIVICTAQIPGKKAPILITEAMVSTMKKGSVIADIAAASGGNCELTEKNKIVEKYSVKIIGYENIPGRVPNDASQLYARNLMHFIQPLIQQKLKRIKIDFEDEIVQKCLITYDGRIAHPDFAKESI